MTSPTRRVVISGPECTGKTTLARTLADRFGVPWIAEYVRGYYDAKGRALESSDVEPIARGQIELEDRALARQPRLLIKDTDLLSTVIYAHHYYDWCPEWIERAAHARVGDLYLLCDVDVPWVADGQRDRPDQRGEMYELFRRRLEMAAVRVVPIWGDWEERDERAMTAVEQLMDERRTGSRELSSESPHPS